MALRRIVESQEVFAIEKPAREVIEGREVQMMDVMREVRRVSRTVSMCVRFSVQVLPERLKKGEYGE